jgi:hypothetical protein
MNDSTFPRLLKPIPTAVLTALAALLFVFIAHRLFAQNDSSGFDKAISSRSVLIVKENSYLETAVGKILIDTLTQKGFHLKTISQSSLPNENSGAYRIIIILNAIKPSGLTAPVKQFMNATNKAQSNVLISTVYGEPWFKNQQSEDAVATATKTLNPEMLAAKLLAYVNSIIERDTGPRAPDSVK